MRQVRARKVHVCVTYWGRMDPETDTWIRRAARLCGMRQGGSGYWFTKRGVRDLEFVGTPEQARCFLEELGL